MQFQSLIHPGVVPLRTVMAGAIQAGLDHLEGLRGDGPQNTQLANSSTPYNILLDVRQQQENSWP